MGNYLLGGVSTRADYLNSDQKRGARIKNAYKIKGQSSSHEEACLHPTNLTIFGILTSLELAVPRYPSHHFYFVCWLWKINGRLC